MHWECRYCDSPFAPIKVDDELICRCGAEWEDAKILVENVELDDDYVYDIDEEPWWSDPDGDEDCNEDNYDEEEHDDHDDYDEMEAMDRRANFEY